MYKYRDDIAHADIAFEVVADKLDEVFSETAKAMFNVMVDLNDVEEKVKKQIKLENTDLERLFFDWLSELVYIKDTEYMLFKKFDVKISQTKGYKLIASIYGEKVDRKKHKLKVDVKAVTMHKFSLKKKDNKWNALVVLDI